MKKGHKQTAEHIEKRMAAKRKGSSFNCLRCGVQFWRKPSAIKRGHCKYCTRACYLKAQVGISKGVGRIGLVGEKNHKWRGGVTPINKAIRQSKEMKAWRLSVFTRDNWTCQKCGNRSRKNNYLRIEAHHIRPFATFPILRFEVSNGLTLCKQCHDQEPKGKEVYAIT